MTFYSKTVLAGKWLLENEIMCYNTTNKNKIYVSLIALFKNSVEDWEGGENAIAGRKMIRSPL